MHVTLRHLRAAQAVAQRRSFRRAAEDLHISQPALSLAVHELESALGVVLFDRNSRSVAVTELGHFFVQGAARLLADFDHLVQEVGDAARSRRGRVVVSCVSSIAGRVMPQAILHCTSRYPGVEVGIRDDVATQVLEQVRTGQADFALTIEPSAVGEGMLFEALLEDPFYVVCERGHPLAARRRVPWKALDGENLIELSTSSGTHRMVRDELARSHANPGRSTAVSHLSTVHGLLEAGFGVAILPHIALPVRAHPTLVARPLVQPALSRTIGIYRRRDRSLTPAAGALIESMREVLGQLSGLDSLSKSG